LPIEDCGLKIAKRRSAFRPSAFFLANPRVSITSSIDRLGCCWLRKPTFGRWQGQFQGQLRSFARVHLCQILTISAMAFSLSLRTAS
jgi:hypothetical protein